MQILAFSFEFFAPPFPAFALSFTLAGMGNIFQVNIIYFHKELQLIILPLARFVGCICKWLHRNSSNGL